MRIIDTIRRAGRSLSQAKTRTFLTSLAIAVGAFTITASLAAAAGGREYATNLVNANADLKELRVMPSSRDSTKPQQYNEGSTFVAGGAGFLYQLFNDDDLATFRAVPGVDTVQPTYTLSVKYVMGPNQQKYNASVNTYNPGIAQDYLAGNGKNLDNRDVLLTDEYRSALGFKDAASAIGQPIQLVIERASTTGTRLVQREILTFTVAGVYKSSSLSFTNGTAMQVNQDATKEMYEYTNQGTPMAGMYDSVILHAKSNNDVESIKANLQAKGYHVLTAQDIMSTLFQFINVLMYILLGFGGLAVLTAIFGIINTQYISVLERTQQIGLMKALGMRRRDVGRLFRYEAAWIGFLGGAIGSMLAFVAGTAANPAIDKALGLEPGTDLLIFQSWMFLVVIGGLMVIAVMAGILPSRKAAKLDPIEALRTE